MKEIDLGSVEDIERRPNLRRFVERRDGRTYLLSENPTGPDSDRWSRRGMMLYIETADGLTFYALDTAGSGGKPDRLLTWVTYEKKAIGDAAAAAERYVMIPKEKLGRPRRVLTEEEKRQVTEWRRAERMSINKISAKLHVGNRLVADFVRTLP